MTIPVSALIADFQQMLREAWRYAWGACRQGEVDCAGAFKWAFEHHGCSLYQGSNRMARTEVVRLCPIGSVQLVPGMVAFKHRIPGDPGYALPEGYKPGGSHHNGDLNDYYHVGLIDEDTARVLNAQGSATGFVASPVAQGWTHVGYLKQVDYGAPQATVTSSATARVHADNGKPVKMRDKPSESCRSWVELPVGTLVTLRGPDLIGWTPVRCGGREGYIMTKFLAPEESPAVPEIETSYAVEFYDLTYEQAARLQAEHASYHSRIEECHG